MPVPLKWVIKLQRQQYQRCYWSQSRTYAGQRGCRTGTTERLCSPRGKIRGNGPKRQPEVQARHRAAPPAVQILKQHGDQKPGETVFVLEDIFK